MLAAPPTFPAFQLLGHRYYDPLRLPRLHLGSLRISLDSRYLAFSCFRSCRFSGGGDHPSAPAWPLLYTGLPVPVPSARRWRFSRVPRLPLCVHAPLADSGGALSTRHCVSRTGAFRQNKNVGFPPTRAGVILSDHDNTVFGAQSRGLHTCYTWLHTYPLGYACRFATDSAANLFWWELSSCLPSPTG